METPEAWTVSSPDDLEPVVMRALGSIRPSAATRHRIDERVAMAVAQTRGRAPSGRRGGRLLRAGLLAAALLALAAGSLAASGVIDLKDGSVMLTWNNADQYDASIAAAEKVTAIPPGYTYPDLRARDRGATYGDALGMVQFNAACAWFGDWRAGFAAGDVARTDRALAVIQALPSWRFYADPEFSTPSLRQAMDIVIAAATSRDRTLVDDFLAKNCGSR